MAFSQESDYTCQECGWFTDWPGLVKIAYH